MTTKSPAPPTPFLALDKLPPHLRPPGRGPSSPVTASREATTRPAARCQEWSDYLARYEDKEL